MFGIQEVINVEEQILHALQHRYGLHLPTERLMYFQTGCKRIAHDFGYASVDGLMEAVISGNLSVDGWKQLVHQATIHESSFYRFPAIYSFCLAYLKYQQGGAIWFPSCSNGQEAYSMAELLIQSGVDDSPIYASDISHECIETAKRGVYRGNEDDRLKSVAPQDGVLTMPDEMKSRVDFTVHNLAGEKIFLGHDIKLIVCTRMLIYYPEDVRHKMLDSMGETLSLGGYICVASLEDAGWSNKRFKLQHNEKFTVFKKIKE